MLNRLANKGKQAYEIICQVDVYLTCIIHKPKIRQKTDAGIPGEQTFIYQVRHDNDLFGLI